MTIRASAVQKSDAPPAPDSSSQDFVAEEDSDKVAFENDGTGTRESLFRVRIQTDAGVKRFSILVFPYQETVEKLEILSVRVLKPDGVSISTPVAEAQDLPAASNRDAPSYGDARERHVSVKGLSTGDVLESRALWRVTKPLVPGEFWLLAGQSPGELVLRRTLEVTVPRERALKWASGPTKPVITEVGNRRRFLWSYAEEVPRSEEAVKAGMVELAYDAARGRSPSPEISMSTFRSWEAVGAWYNGLIRDRVLPTADIRAKAAELTRDAKDDNARIQAIYAFVSTQIRYIGVEFGIGRYQPHTASEVLSNKFGDCKDKHALLSALLAAVQIPAYPVLIPSRHVVDASVPSPGQFDHLISAIPHGGGYLWLDTTSEVAPAGYLIDILRGKSCLVIPKDGPAVLTTTPADPPAPLRRIVRMDATLSDIGTLEGNTEISLQGDDVEVIVRSAFRQTSMARWKDLAQALSYQSGFAGTVSDVQASSAVDTLAPFHISYKYTRPNYPDWPNRRVGIPLPSMGLADESEKPPHRVWLGVPGELRFEASLAVPKGSVPKLPPDQDIRKTFADYVASYRLEKNVIRAVRTMTVKQREIPVAEFEVYRSFAETVAADSASMVDLAAPPRVSMGSYQDAVWQLPLSKNLEAARSYEDAQAAFQKHDGEGEVASLKQSVAVDPTFTRAWLWLGEIYKSQGKQAPALQAYRSAIQHDPHEPLSYKVLAFNLLIFGRAAEAVPVWRQLTEVSAKDPDGFLFLGGTLSELKRYSEAATALESALALAPERGEIAVLLGTAYLRTGNVTKAFAAYERGLTGDPPPEWLNDAAYAMAEKRQRLPVALEYAQRAVRALEESSAKTSLADLKFADLFVPPRISACWDTLGWVHSGMGHLDLARRYLEAAWKLSQRPEEGDHLGQVYERLHQPQEAARIYRLALASGRSRDTVKEKDIEARLDRIQGKSGSGGRSGGREELMTLRTIRLPPMGATTGSADFFLLVGPGGRITDVKFISGASELKGAEKPLRAAAIDSPFPDDRPTRILRRGVASCATNGCSVVLYPPDVVNSLE